MGVPPEAWSQLNMSPGNLARRIERGMVSPSKAHEAYTSSEVDTVPKPTNQSKTVNLNTSVSFVTVLLRLLTCDCFLGKIDLKENILWMCYYQKCFLVGIHGEIEFN